MAINDQEQLAALTPLARLAIAVADHCCRSDIECYVQSTVRDGIDVYDLDQPVEEPRMTDADRAFFLRTAANAAEYIAHRGDVFTWRMERTEGAPNLVWFVDQAVPA